MKKTIKFEKSLGIKDMIMMVIGCMIGWGWVINSGDWLMTAGLLGTLVALIIGTAMMVVVGLTYAELTTSIPKCGGEIVFTLLGLGHRGSFICGWSIAFSYVALAMYEAGAVATGLHYLLGSKFVFGCMYSIGSSPVYLSNILMGLLVAAFITWLNICSVKNFAKFQNIIVGIMIACWVVLGLCALLNGSLENVSSNMFIGSNDELRGSSFISGTFNVVCMTPFLFVGFDILPQAVEEVNFKIGKVGKIMIWGILFASLWYFVVAISVSLCMNRDEIKSIYDTGLVTVDAIKKVTHSNFLGNSIIIGGMCGILSSWNAYILGGSRALYSLAREKIIPISFSKASEKYNTPVLSIVLVGAISAIAPFFGRTILLWLVDVSGFSICITYMLVAIAFLSVRKKYPNLNRPFKVRFYKLIGILAFALTAFMLVLYIFPIKFSNCNLKWQEWLIFLSWGLLGVILYFVQHRKHVEKKVLIEDYSKTNENF